MSKNTAKNTATVTADHSASGEQIVMIPAGKLVPSARNARDAAPLRNIPELAATIKSQGVLHNLIVTENADGTFPVEAGRRRHAAIALLIEQGTWDADRVVPCRIVPVDSAIAVSAIENSAREAMHPADEFRAYSRLFKDEKRSIDFIANAFGVTPLYVERRLALDAAAPALLDTYRAGKMNLDQLIALCATEDHAVQLRVWSIYGSQSYNNSPTKLRRAVLGERIDAAIDERVTFIGGIDAFTAAGGVVERDLFTDAGGFIADVALLDKLVGEKIEQEAERLRGEGWAWVEVQGSVDRTALQRMGRIEADDALMAAEPAARVKALRDEADRLDAENAAMFGDEDAGTAVDELDDEQGEKYDANEERAGQLREQAVAIADLYADFPAALKANAGVILAFSGGSVEIIKGLVLTADRAKVAEAAGSADAVSGGRESTPAGRKNGDALSDTLRRSLLGHRNLAAQIATASKPDAAKILLACWTVTRIRADYGSAPTNLSIGGSHGTLSGYPIADEAGKARGVAFALKARAAVAALPKADGPLWDALAALSPAELDALIAYGVALSVSLNTETTGLTAKFLAALDFDMAEHFTPTAANYFGGVAKPLIVGAMAEAGKVKDAAHRDALLAMKKGALATEAETSLAGSGWVPALIRTAKPKAPAEPKARPKAAAKPAAKKTAAKKTPAKPTPKTKAKAKA